MLTILILIISGLIIKTKFEAKEQPPKVVKLPGFAISASKPKSASKDSQSLSPRRTTQVILKPQTKMIAAQTAREAIRPPLETLSTEQKIERIAHAWQKVRTKALDQLGVDTRTREMMDVLKAQCRSRIDLEKIDDCGMKLQDLLGESNFTYLNRVRDEFRNRVFDRAQIEAAPYIGEL